MGKSVWLYHQHLSKSQKISKQFISVGLPETPEWAGSHRISGHARRRRQTSVNQEAGPRQTSTLPVPWPWPPAPNHRALRNTGPAYAILTFSVFPTSPPLFSWQARTHSSRLKWIVASSEKSFEAFSRQRNSSPSAVTAFLRRRRDAGHQTPCY